MTSQSALAQHDDQQVEELPYRLDLRVGEDGQPTPYRLAMAWRYLNFDLEQGTAAEELTVRFRFYERLAREKHFAIPYLAALDDVRRMDKKIESYHRLAAYQRYCGQQSSDLTLFALTQGPKSIEWLSKKLRLSEPSVRRHLRKLRDRGRAQFDPKSNTWCLSLVSTSLPVSKGDHTTTESRSVGPTQTTPRLETVGRS